MVLLPGCWRFIMVQSSKQSKQIDIVDNPGFMGLNNINDDLRSNLIKMKFYLSSRKDNVLNDEDSSLFWVVDIEQPKSDFDITYIHDMYRHTSGLKSKTKIEGVMLFRMNMAGDIEDGSPISGDGIFMNMEFKARFWFDGTVRSVTWGGKLVDNEFMILIRDKCFMAI
jgi:hypothetical protein